MLHVFSLKKGAIIRIVYGCNHECHFCHERENIFSLDFSSISVGDLEQIYSWIQQNNFDYVVISGGEPTLHPQLVDIILFFQQKNIYVVIVNNGTYLHKHDFSKIEREKITWYISYHGLKNEYEMITRSHDFERVTENITKLSTTFPEVILRCVVNSLNISNLKQYTEFVMQKFPEVFLEFVLLEDLRFSHVQNTVIPLKDFYINVLPFLKNQRILLDGGAACFSPWLFMHAAEKCDPLVNTMRGLIKKEKTGELLYSKKENDAQENIKSFWKKCKNCSQYQYCHGFDIFYLRK